MASRVVLHVGTMKSATTYLQHTWDRNRDLLASQGVQWPGSALGFAGVADRLADDEHKRPDDGDWPGLVGAVERHDGTVLLSNELLSLRRTRKLEPFVRETGWPLEVVITARDLGRVVPSQWVTGALNRRPTPWPEFAAALMDDDRAHPAVAWFWRRQDLPALIRTWSQLVGEAAITVVTVPPPGAGTKVVLERFLGLIDVDPTAFVEAEPEPTVGVATAEFVRRLGLALPDLPRGRWNALTSALLEPLRDQPREPKLKLDSEQLAWAQSKAQAIASAVDSLGVRVVGSVDDLIPSLDDAGDEPVRGPDDEELLAAAIRSIAALVSHDGTQLDPLGDRPESGG